MLIMPPTFPRQDELIPHGTIDYAELRALGLRPEDLIHFSSNINPYGPPPSVVDALRAAANAEMIARYPDRLSFELRELLAEYHHLSVDSILVGNGSADLLWLIGLLHLHRRRVVILGPTFGEYRHIANIRQAMVVDLCHPGWVLEKGIYAPGKRTLEETAAEIQQSKPDVIFVCNPNNPTGQQLHMNELVRLYAAAPHALWIIDEAYAEFMEQPLTSTAMIEHGNWLILRSMTKDFALGGLRLGYLLGTPAAIKSLQTAQPPWNVNTFAQQAGAIALRDGQAWRRETLAHLRLETNSLQERLRGIGFQPYSTLVNYFLLPVDSASRVRNELLAQRLVVRDCTSFGLPNFIRIATQLPEANERLFTVLREVATASKLSAKA